LAASRQLNARYTHDFVVIGAGSAGLVAAGFAARLGVRVALVERDRIGGDCTWTGCVPSKALLRAARIAHDIRTSGSYGIHAGAPSTDMVGVRDYVRLAIARTYAAETPERLGAKGIDLVAGAARFLDVETIAVGERRLRAKRFLIATGAHATTPPIEGLGDVPFATYETIFDNDRLPRSLVVIGGGPVGSELAQAYRRFGSGVTIVATSLLPKEDDDVRRVVDRVFDREGIRRLSGCAHSMRREGEDIVVAGDDGAARGDMLLVATGRVPNVDGLDLDKAGVDHSDRGISVDGRFRTNVKSIFAAGDVIGGEQYAHFAGWQAFYATRNALLPFGSARTADSVPRVTFTDPEVAHVGPTFEAARARYEDIELRKLPIGDIDRAITENDEDGFIRILTRRNGTILAATIVAARAGEAITELALAVNQKLRARQLATAIHAYPTYSTAVQQMTADLSVERSLAALQGRIASRLARFCR